MKKFNRILALILTLVTVLAMLPATVVASESWLDVSGKNDGTASTVTVTLDAEQLLAVLKGGVSASTLKAVLANISVTGLSQVITVEELFEIVPKETLLNIFKPEDIMNDLDKDELDALVNSILSDNDKLNAIVDEMDMDALAALITRVGVTAVIDPAALLDAGILTTGEVGDYILYDVALEKIQNTPGAMDRLTAEFIEKLDTVADLGAIVDLSGVALSGLIDLGSVAIPSKIADVLDGLDESVIEDYVSDTPKSGYIQVRSDLYADVQGLNNDSSIAFTFTANMVDTAAAKTALKNVSDKAALTSYITDKKAALQLLEVATVTDILGGSSVLAECVKQEELFAAYPASVIVERIEAKGQSVADYVNLSALMDNATVDELFDIVAPEVLMAQVGTDKLVELLGKLNLADYVTAESLVPVIERIKANVKHINLAGQEIATADADTGLGLNLQNLVRAIPSLLITLGDVASMENGKLKTTSVAFSYTPNGTTDVKTKSINLELVLAGNTEKVKAAATKLYNAINSLFRIERSADGTVSVYINIPSIAADVVKTILNTSNISEETMSKLLHFGNDGTAEATPENAVLFIENLTFDELLEVLGGLDLDALYSYVMNKSYIQAVLNKVGYSGVGSLDGAANALVNLSVEDVCNQVTAFVHKDVMAILESGALKLDGLTEAEKVARLLALVSEKTGFDVSGLKPSALLETYKDVPVFEVVSNAIAAKVGVDVKAVIESQGITGIYSAAVEQAEALRGAFETIQSKVGILTDVLPDALLSLNIADFYKGNGEFNVSKALSLDPGALLEKLSSRLSAQVNDILTVLGIQDLSPISMTLDVHVRLSGIYRISYMDQSGEATLMNVFLPAGTKLDIFRNDASITAGYEFTGWYDEDGNELNVMPSRDCVVRADLEASIIKFVDSQGNLIGMITTDGVLSNKYRNQIAEVEANALNFIPATTDPNQYLDSDFYWYQLGDATKTAVELKNLGGSMVLVMEVTPNYFITVGDGLLVDRACNGRTHTITVLNDSFTEIRITMSVANFLELAQAKKTTLVVSIRGEYELVDFSNKVMVQLYEAAVAARASSVTFVYTPNGTKAGDFKNTYFDGADSAEFHRFKIFFGTNEKKTFSDNFAGNLSITLPYDTLVNVSGARTSVYVMGASGKEEIDAVAKRKYISFKAPHFSDYVLVNEYLVKQTIVNNDGTAVDVINTEYPLNNYYPAGTVIPMDFVVGKDGSQEEAYAISSITSSVESALVRGELTVPKQSVTITITLEGRLFYIYYYVNGNLFKTQTYTTNDYLLGQNGDADSKLKYQCMDFTDEVLALMPAGYASGEWVGHTAAQAGKSDMYVYAVWTPKSYTIEFKGAASYVFTIEDYKNVIVTPAVPASRDAALVGAWKDWTGVDNYNWSAFFAGTETKLEIEAEYTARSFNVVSDGAETFEIDGSVVAGGEAFTVAAGTRVYVEAFGKKHQIGSVRIYTIQGDRVNVDEDGFFTMPASPITVSVAYTNARYNYTINGGEPQVGFGNQYTSFQIEVPAGQFLTQLSDGCVLTAVEDTANGGKLLTYSIVLTEDNQNITYTLGTSASGLVYIVDGALTDGTTPDDKNFDKWSVFNANGSILNFAAFLNNEVVRSLLWLWIVLAIILLIALITVLYRLYINGKLKPNFFLRFIAWLVSGFFAVCLAVAACGLAVLRLFGKDDYEKKDYVPEPEDASDADETNEDDSVETAAEVAEEATDADAAEPVEEATETEATEEVAEEAAEEVAEEVAPEGTEDAAETEATEETTEEVAQETAEEVNEEATEEVTETEAAEDVAEEATETDADADEENETK